MSSSDSHSVIDLTVETSNEQNPTTVIANHDTNAELHQDGRLGNLDVQINSFQDCSNQKYTRNTVDEISINQEVTSEAVSVQCGEHPCPEVTPFGTSQLNGSMTVFLEFALQEQDDSESTLDELHFALRRVFGLDAFRPQQEAIIKSIVSGLDTFVLLPTGGGKSLCYQLPSVLVRGITIVVSPLLSLIQDQVRALVSMPSGGIPATYLSSTQNNSDRRAVYKELRKPNSTCKLLYLTPEQLTANVHLIDIIKMKQIEGNLARIVIDEAHCVSMWGHDFRSAYKDLSLLKARKSLFPGVQIVALTATANDQVKREILQVLGFAPTSKKFQVSFYRSNLKFIVVEKRSSGTGVTMLLQYIHSRDSTDCGIVYCLSRDESESVAKELKGKGIKATHYHAGMRPKEREIVQNSWKNGKLIVVVATIAFGMGIDNPHVRYVVHFVLSKSLEGYYQEAGRAGRDGEPSDCVLFYSRQDLGRIKTLFRLNPATDYKKGN
eukprot:g758.t1